MSRRGVEPGEPVRGRWHQTRLGLAELASEGAARTTAVKVRRECACRRLNGVLV